MTDQKKPQQTNQSKLPNTKNRDVHTWQLSCITTLSIFALTVLLISTDLYAGDKIYEGLNSGKEWLIGTIGTVAAVFMLAWQCLVWIAADEDSQSRSWKAVKNKLYAAAAFFFGGTAIELIQGWFQ